MNAGALAAPVMLLLLRAVLRLSTYVALLHIESELVSQTLRVSVQLLLVSIF